MYFNYFKVLSREIAIHTTVDVDIRFSQHKKEYEMTQNLRLCTCYHKYWVCNVYI